MEAPHGKKRRNEGTEHLDADEDDTQSPLVNDKKKKEDSSSDNEDDEEHLISEDDEDDEDAFSEVQVDFEFFNPKEEDYHAIKRFLEELLHHDVWNCSEMANFIIEQPDVGTVIRVGDQSMGFVSVINLQKYKEITAVGQIVDYMLRKAPGDAERTRLSALLEDNTHPVGLIISLRMINVPPQLAPHLHKGLFDEIRWAREDELTDPDTSGKENWRFDKYLLLTSVYTEGRGDSSAQPQSKKKRTGVEETFPRPEEEIYLKHTEWSYTFPVERHELSSWWTFQGMVSENGVVMCINVEDVPNILDGISDLCTDGSGVIEGEDPVPGEEDNV